jgi:hypothetical protein
MDAPFHMQPDAIEYLSRTLRGLSERVGYEISLQALLDRWKRFVAEVEEGYLNSIYEYANDVAVRTVIYRIEVDAPWSLRKTMASYLRPLDKRFFDATSPVTVEIPGLARDTETPWAARVPNRLQGELAEDLRDAGVVI